MFSALGLFGLLGIGGLAAGTMFIPGALPIVISIGGAILRCKPCLIALAISAAFIWGDVHGHRKSDAVCKANDIAMQLKATQRDAAIQKDAAEFAKKQVETLDAENAGLNRRLADYENAPHTACPLGDRAERLRGLAPR